MVRVGFFDRFPMAATKLLSLEDAMLSFDLECFMMGNGLLSAERLEALERIDWTSFADLDLVIVFVFDIVELKGTMGKRKVNAGC